MLKRLTVKQGFLVVIALALGIEAVVLLFRFGLGLEVTRDTASTVGVLTGGLRIHHGYLGLLCIGAAGLLWRSRFVVAQWLLMVGLSLVLSDLIHHFIVLWLTVGSPEFHLVYPGR